MPIVVHCPACNRRYQIDEQLSGKRARCPCGATMQVPTGNSGAPDADWVADAFSESKPAASAAAEPDSPPPVVPARPGVRAVVQPPPVDLIEELAGPRAPSRKKLIRRVMAVLAIVYGLGAAGVFVVIGVMAPSADVFDFFEWLAMISLGVGMAAGGVLTWRRHPMGPAWAALSALFLCFFPAWDWLRWLLAALMAGAWLVFLGQLLLGAAMFAIPIAVTAWGLKMEKARQVREEKDREMRLL